MIAKLSAAVVLTRRVNFAHTQNISEFKPLELFVQQIIKISQIKYAITAQLQGGGENDRKNIAFTCNTISKKVSDVFEVPLNGLNDVYDSHRRASIDMDSDGYIYLVEEKGKESESHSDGHNTELYIWKSTSVKSTNELTKVNTIAGNYSYPNAKLINDKIYITARSSAGSRSNDIFVSPSFTRNIFITLSTNRAYPRVMYSDDGYYWHVVNERNDTYVTWPAIHVMRTLDGITWQNIDGWSKNVTSAAITQAEADTNLRAFNVSDDTTKNAIYMSGHVKNGTPKMLVMMADNTGNTREGNPEVIITSLRWYYHSNGWQYTDVSSFFPSGYIFYPFAERYFISTKTVDNEYIYVIDPDDNRSVYEYKSKNNFQTYTKRKVLEGNGNYLIGNVSTQNTSHRDILLCVYDTEGTWWTGTGYNWDGYSNLIFIRP